MRIAHSTDTHIVCLTDAEASSLVDACALIVLAVQSDPRIAMPAHMGTVLCALFEGLRSEVSACGAAGH